MFDLILAVGLAIGISATCSITEAVLYSVPWSFIERLRKEGRVSGHILFEMRKNVERPISAILTLNTIANTAGASIAGAAAARVFGEHSMVAFATAFTLSILIFSEILPKTLGVAYARQVAPVMARPLMFLVTCLTPAVWLTSFLTRLIKPKESGPKATEEDIHALATLTRRSGHIEDFEEVAIKNIITLDTRLVRDIMTPRTVVFSLPADITVQQAKGIRDLFHYSRIPVFDEGDTEDIVGLVYRRDIMQTLADDRHAARISELMRPVRFVLETLTVDKLLLHFFESRSHLLVVLDEYGGVAGVVSLEDVVETILGREIVDETDSVADLRQLARTRRRQLTRPK